MSSLTHSSFWSLSPPRRFALVRFNYGVPDGNRYWKNSRDFLRYVFSASTFVLITTSILFRYHVSSSRRIFHARDTFMRMREQVAGVLLAVHFRPLGWLWGIGLWLVGRAVFASVHHQGRRLLSPHNNPSVLYLHSHRDSHCHLLSMKSI